MARPTTDAGSAADRKRITTYVSPELWKRLRRMALEREVPVWAIAEAAIAAYLDREE